MRRVLGSATTTIIATTATLAAVALFGPASGAAAATTPRYSITDLGSFAGDLSVATAINNAGVVVGYSDVTSGLSHAFRWSAGTLTDLGIEPGGSNSVANAINDAGQIAGTADRTSGGYGYPVRWSATGVLQDLGGSIVNELGVGNGIDPSGRVVGGQRPADSEGGPNATLYDQAGNRTNLGTPPTSLNAATAINAVGQVVGSPAFVWQSGTVTLLPGLPGAITGSGVATAINVGGQIVGSTGLASGSGSDAALWQHGVLTDLGTIGTIGYNTATGINAAGQVVGTASPGCSPCAAPQPWIWQAGTSLTALSTLIPSGSGWTLSAANGINDRGQIVGTGVHNGHQRAFLLTPSFAANINFQPASSTVPTGYSVDSGAVYGSRTGGLSYGWNIDNSVNTRDRNAAASPDQRYDTLIHMERSGSATSWELAVPNGRYTVHIVSGDPSATDSVYRVDAEGVLAVSGTPSATNLWIDGTVLVTVSDGRLTITNGTGSSNDKLDYIDVIAS
jgi:probable HAF family extracellular repeat protein